MRGQDTVRENADKRVYAADLVVERRESRGRIASCKVDILTTDNPASAVTFPAGNSAG